MKKLLLLLLVSTFSISISNAQCNGLFYSQADIDNFSSNCPNSSLLEHIVIDGSDITNLIGLSQIDLCYSLTIQNTSLVNLEGLENLQESFNDVSLTGNSPGVYIRNNPLLDNLNGLQGLRKTSNLSIENNAILKNTNALNITEFEKYLDIRLRGNDITVIDNPMLTNLVGINALTESSGIIISNNASLVDLSGLSNLTAVSYLPFDQDDAYFGTFELSNNDALVNLEAFNSFYAALSIIISDNDNLTKLGDNITISSPNFRIENNLKLEAFGDINLGMWNPLWIWGFSPYEFHIKNNPVLTDIQVLSFTPSTVKLSVQITGNDLLSFCDVNYLCDLIIENPSTTEIQNNAPECHILFAKDFCGIDVFSGTINYDENCNDIVDGVDASVRNITIRDISGLPVGSTNDQGVYAFSRFTLDDPDVEIRPDSIIGFTTSPESITMNLDTSPSDHALNFYMCPDSIFSNLKADLTAVNRPRPGFLNSYQLCITNLGSQVENGAVSFKFLNSSDLEMYLSYILTDGATVNNLDLSWSFNDLSVFETICYDVEVSLLPSTPLGLEMNSKLNVESTLSLPEISAMDNCSVVDQTVVNSYDPNDKTVTPNELTLDQLEEINEFEFQIRFQNTGTANAQFINILDTIPSTLDMSSFEMISASHPFKLLFERNTIRWTFLDIDLPAQQDDEMGSQGFVKFKISNVAGLDSTQIIKNRAGIYFDYNEPIITEYANVLFYAISDSDDITYNNSFTIFPNPASHKINIKIDQDYKSDLHIKLNGLDGSLFQEGTIRYLKDYSLDVGDLPAGLYLLTIQLENRIHVEKLFIE